jgi:hypothetical protein
MKSIQVAEYLGEGPVTVILKQSVPHPRVCQSRSVCGRYWQRSFANAIPLERIMDEFLAEMPTLARSQLPSGRSGARTHR